MLNVSVKFIRCQEISTVGEETNYEVKFEFAFEGDASLQTQKFSHTIRIVFRISNQHLADIQASATDRVNWKGCFYKLGLEHLSEILSKNPNPPLDVIYKIHISDYPDPAHLYSEPPARGECGTIMLHGEIPGRATGTPGEIIPATSTHP